MQQLLTRQAPGSAPEQTAPLGVSNPITRLNAALEGRYRIERDLGEGGMARAGQDIANRKPSSESEVWSQPLFSCEHDDRAVPERLLLLAKSLVRCPVHSLRLRGM